MVRRETLSASREASCREDSYGEDSCQCMASGAAFIAADPSLATVATSGARCGNTLRTARQTFRAASALRKKRQTDVRRARPPRRQQSLCGLGCPKITHSPIHPAAKPTYIGIAHVAVEAHHNQSLRRSDRGRRAASRPAKIPDAAQCNRESQHGRNCRQPSPARRARHFHAETEPSRQQPEPQAEERRAHHQRDERSQPAIAVPGRWIRAVCASVISPPLWSSISDARSHFGAAGERPANSISIPSGSTTAPACVVFGWSRQQGHARDTGCTRRIQDLHHGSVRRPGVGLDVKTLRAMRQRDP